MESDPRSDSDNVRDFDTECDGDAESEGEALSDVSGVVEKDIDAVAEGVSDTESVGEAERSSDTENDKVTQHEGLNTVGHVLRAGHDTTDWREGLKKPLDIGYTLTKLQNAVMDETADVPLALCTTIGMCT